MAFSKTKGTALPGPRAAAHAPALRLLNFGGVCFLPEFSGTWRSRVALAKHGAL